MIVLGRGRVGRSLVRAFRAAGRAASLKAGRSDSFTLPSQGIVFIAVPDSAVTEVAAKLAGTEASPDVSFVHVSGALGLDAMAPLRERHAVGSFHPLRSFPAPAAPAAFRGIVVAVDASTPSLLRRLRSLARLLGARAEHVPDRDRVLYHAAAVFASNYVDVVVNEAVRLLKAIGWSEAESTAALMPLVEGAVANIRKRGPIQALTGPIRRGDAATVDRHVSALEKVGRAAQYRMLGQVALEVATEAGLEPAAARRVKRALTRKAAATRRRRRR